MNQEKKTFAVLLKVDDEPLLLSMYTHSRFASPKRIIEDLHCCFHTIYHNIDYAVLNNLKKTGEIYESTLDAFATATITAMLMIVGHKNTPLSKDDFLKLSNFAKKHCSHKPDRIMSLVKTKATIMEDFFTMDHDSINKAIKAADSYAIIDLNKSLEIVLEDLVFLKNDSLERKLSSILEPFDIVEFMEYVQQNPTKTELINFLNMATTTEGRKFKIFMGSIKDNLKIVYDSFDRDKKVPFKAIKITPYSGNEDVIKIHLPSIISFGTRSIPVFIDKKDGISNLDFLPFM